MVAKIVVTDMQFAYDCALMHVLKMTFKLIDLFFEAHQMVSLKVNPNGTEITHQPVKTPLKLLK